MQGHSRCTTGNGNVLLGSGRRLQKEFTCGAVLTSRGLDEPGTDV